MQTPGFTVIALIIMELTTWTWVITSLLEGSCEEIMSDILTRMVFRSERGQTFQFILLDFNSFSTYCSD